MRNTRLDEAQAGIKIAGRNINKLRYAEAQEAQVSLVAQRVKCLPIMQETRVRSLGREDPLEKEMATHSSVLAWKIPWTEDPGGATVQLGHRRVGYNLATTTM